MSGIRLTCELVICGGCFLGRKRLEFIDPATELGLCIN